MLLSIIIPYYKTLELTRELIRVLKPQLTEEVEVIIVDDGCNEEKLDKLGVRVIHLPENSGNASTPRNIGIENTTGKYVAFIDSDDMVSKDYIKTILEYTKENTDIIYISWKAQTLNMIIRNKPPTWNCSVWCRVYKRSIIGDIRFDKKLDIAEDWKFNQKIKFNSSVAIPKVLYYYNNTRQNSLTRKKVKK